MLDVRVGRRVPVDVDVHRPRAGVDRRAGAPCSRKAPPSWSTWATSAAKRVLRLDRQETGRRSSEVVDAQDGDLVLVTLDRRLAVAEIGDAESGRLRALLGVDVGLTLDEAVPPGVLVLDRRAQLEAGVLEGIQLIGVAEDLDRDAAVGVLLEVVVVEVDSILPGVQLQLDRRRLVRQDDLDETPILVRVDAPRVVLGGRAACNDQRESGCGKQRPQDSPNPHSESSPCKLAELPPA